MEQLIMALLIINTLVIVLISINILITLTAVTEFKKIIILKSEEINDQIQERTSMLGYDLGLVAKQVAKEKIRHAVKGERSDEIRKLAFTPIKINR